MPAGDAQFGEGFTQLRHLLLQVFRHRRAPGLVVWQNLVAPAFAAVVLVKYRHRVGRAAVLKQLLQRVATGVDARGALYGVNAADEVQGVDNQ